MNGIDSLRRLYPPTPQPTTTPPPAERPKPEASAPPLAASTVAAANADAKAIEMGKRLDAFFADASGPYAITDASGTKVAVAAPANFRMVGGYNFGTGEDARLRKALGDKTYAKLSHEIARVRIGRGTPADVAAVTRALIDAGKLELDPASVGKEGAAAKAIQAMQWKYGLGFDCAGYVQRAFFAARGMTGTPSERNALGLAASPANEGFGALPTNPHFERVAPESARAGDLILLGPPAGEKVGHVVIVRGKRTLDAMEQAKLGIGKPFTGPIVRIDVDSSWGAGEEGNLGGVKRVTWLFDPQTQRWATYDPTTKKATPSSTSGPYDHPLTGIFRPKTDRGSTGGGTRLGDG